MAAPMMYSRIGKLLIYIQPVPVINVISDTTLQQQTYICQCTQEELPLEIRLSKIAHSIHQ